MSILYLLIPLAAVLVILAAALFIWSIKSGQFEDLEGPGFRILMDDDDDMIPDDAKVKNKAAVKKDDQQNDSSTD
jgi:cbb3-type cytochrome oxidase maturation protein